METRQDNMCVRMFQFLSKKKALISLNFECAYKHTEVKMGSGDIASKVFFFFFLLCLLQMRGIRKRRPMLYRCLHAYALKMNIQKLFATKKKSFNINKYTFAY